VFDLYDADTGAAILFTDATIPGDLATVIVYRALYADYAARKRFWRWVQGGRLTVYALIEPKATDNGSVNVKVVAQVDGSPARYTLADGTMKLMS
jgi:hypothetical protein